MTASVVENSTTTVYQATATDPEGNALSYSIVGGSDAARFAITANGTLTFVVAPNFDLPTDADGNNIYLVQLRVSDGQDSTTLDLQVTVTNSKEGISVRRIASGFIRPIAVVPIPGDTRVFVAEKGGTIYLLDPASGTRTTFLTINVGNGGELTALAVSPNYATSGQFAVMYTVGQTVYVADGRRRGTFLVPEIGETIIAERHAQYDNDLGGWIGYGPDGKLYVATGDAGGSGDPTGSAQGSTALGKVLRVDNNPDPFAGASPKYFITTNVAIGFHNPRGGTFLNGALLLGDRGQDVNEEINLVALTTTSGNYGWPFKEGTAVVRTGAPAATIDPVTQYPRGTGLRAGTGVIGGYVYRGPITSLAGQYVFADQGGAIFSVPASSLTSGQTLGATAYERRNEDFAPDAGSLREPLGIGEDSAGNLYIVDGGGDVFRVGPG